MRILVVEDDPVVVSHLERILADARFITDVANDGERAWFLGDTESYAAAILDLGLPQLDGISVLKRWRQANRMMPVIVLTARGSWRERVDGINAGADDYLGKPFEADELLARLHAVLRRAGGFASPEIVAGGVRLEPRSMKVTVNGRPVKLTPLEYRATLVLMHNCGTVVGFQDLYENVYGTGEASSNTLERLIARLRQRLGVNVIETRRGAGYVIPDHPR
ncbi:MAG: response regulator transcription factor [Hyphomicrobium sp.]